MKLQKKIIISHVLLTSLIFLAIGVFLPSVFKNYFILLFLLALCLSVIIGLSISKGIVRRINEVTEFSREISRGNFVRRLLMPKDDEIGELGENINLMAEELKTKVETLIAKKEILETIFNILHDGLLVIDSKGNITLASPAIRRILGMGSPVSEDIIGRPFFEVLRDPVIQDAMKEAKNSQTSALREVEIFHPSNKHLYVTVTPLRSKIIGAGFMIVLHDITQLRHLETVRKDFVASVSHELKTPITAIRGFAETLLDGAMEDKESARRYLEIIKNHSERLNNLVEDLLTLSSLDKGEIHLHLEPVDIKGLVDVVFLTLRDRAYQKHIRLINNVGTDFPHITADKNRLTQIFLNLIDNAIKFTEFGEVRVTGKVLSETENGNLVEISVEDTGIGISAKDIPRLGERFYRVDISRSRALGGTGLGLAIVKHLVQIHGWQMRIESEVGRGTKVILRGEWSPQKVARPFGAQRKGHN